MRNVELLINRVHESVNGLLDLADYCEAVVCGYNEFKIKNGVLNQNISSLKEQFDFLKQYANSLYQAVIEGLRERNWLENDFVINSSPVVFGNRSIFTELKYADSGDHLMSSIKGVEQQINRKVSNLIKNAEDLAIFNEIDVEDFQMHIVSGVNGILDVTRDGLIGLGDCAKNIKSVEEKYFDK